MLTRDNAATAQTIAQETGVDEVRAELLPGDKGAAVSKWPLTITVFAPRSA